jgi:hypothetical protein
MKSDVVISHDAGVHTWCFTPQTPEAWSWSEKENGRKGTIDLLTEEGVRELADRAQEAGLTVHWDRSK